MKNDASSSVPSPCISVCTVDEDSGYCLGCARTLREVARWRRLDNTEKQRVIDEIPARKRQMEQDGADIRWRKN